jgi:hypothetical protein
MHVLCADETLVEIEASLSLDLAGIQFKGPSVFLEIQIVALPRHFLPLVYTTLAFAQPVLAEEEVPQLVHVLKVQSHALFEYLVETRVRVVGQLDLKRDNHGQLLLDVVFKLEQRNLGLLEVVLLILHEIVAHFLLACTVLGADVRVTGVVTGINALVQVFNLADVVDV